MLLKTVRVRDYRSITDSGDVEIEPAKTLLVGVNEAGKTALLRAIQHINPPASAESLSALRDYPRARYTEIQRGEKDPADITVAEAVFTLTEQEKALVLNESPLSSDVEELVLWRRLDGSRGWNFGKARLRSFYSEIEADLQRLRAHLAKQPDTEDLVGVLAGITKNRKPHTPLMGKFADDLGQWLSDVLPLVDEDNERELARHAKLVAGVLYNAQTTSAGAVVQSRTPMFVYYSTYFTVRPRINLPSLAAREEAGDIDEEYDFGNLCLLKLLGFTARELSDLAAGEPRPDNYAAGVNDDGYKDAVQNHQARLDDRQYRLNAASVDLTNSIREVWGDERVQLSLRADGQYLKVVVVDDIGVEVELDQRSEGFRWLVSFFVVFKAQARGDLRNAILLLDEPGLSLHALKQQEFRKTVSRLATDNQVIYTTHSPFMVGTDELDLVRIVEMTDRSIGTKVHTRMVVDDPKSIYPLQAALGYELAQSLFGQRRNLVCEGLTDMMYIEALNTVLSERGKGFKHEVGLVPASSASKVIYYTTILISQRLRAAALLDSDQAGETAAKQDELIRLLTQKRILRTKDCYAGSVRKPEVEDLLRQTLVEVARAELGWDVSTSASAQAQRPIIDIFSDEIPGFSKYKLVRAFIRWLTTHDVSELDATEQSNVEKLFEAINRALA